VFKIYADPQVATLALRSGEVDCLPLVSTPTEVAGLLTDKQITVDIITNYNSTIMFLLNMRVPPLNVLNVRKAMDMALNKADMITFGAFGYGTLPSQVPFPPGLAESNNDITWEKTYVDGTGAFKSQATRVADANALLDAVPGMSTIAGGIGGIRTYVDPNGVAQKVSFEGLYMPSPTYQRLAELAAEDMAEIGIEIVPTVETGAFGPKVFGGQVWQYETIIFGYPGAPEFDGMVKQWGMPTYGANYDGSVVGFNQNPNDPWTDNGADQPGAATGPKPMTYDTPNWATATTAEKAFYKQLWQDLMAMAAPIEADLRATRTMSDPVERLAAVKEVQADFAAVLPVVNLYHPQYMSAYREDRFEGWDVEGVFLYGFMPPPTSIPTLMKLSAISST
jgi:ABC-type transport system substrate-binding protein